MSDRLKILHVEDLSTDAEMVNRVLQKSTLQFEKKDVDNRRDFESSLDRFQPDVILSDHSLPTFNSLEALTIVNQKQLHIPFILVTATVSEEYAVNIMKEGACDYILKDRLQRLPNAITGALEKYRLEREAEMVLTETSVRVQEKEREEVGRELHDNINQVLSSSKMYFETALEEYPENILLEKGLKQLTQAITEIRKLSHLLVAPELERTRLVQAIVNLAENSREAGKVKIHYEAGRFNDEKVSNAIKHNLYRIVQEQFNNVLRHSKAKNLLIILDMTNDHVALTMRDDGIGFDASKMQPGIGLRNISNRVKLFNGNMKLHCPPENGCILEVVMPV